MSRRPAASYKPQTPACPAIRLQICAFVFNHFQDAPPAISFPSTFCIVAGGWHGSRSIFLFHLQCCGNSLQCCGNSKSFICHTSKELPANSFACHTSKTALPQLLCLPHLRPPPPGQLAPGCGGQPQLHSFPLVLRRLPFRLRSTATSQIGRGTMLTEAED